MVEQRHSMTVGVKRQGDIMAIGGKRRRHSMANIVPYDMVEEILSKLPVKSLCRFRCASNSLLALISNPQFIKLHLNRSQKKQRLMALSQSYCYSADLETSLPTIFSHPLFKIEERLKFVGSCNGLICFQLTHLRWQGQCKFIVSNPSTRESKTIPEFKTTGSYESYGFGYAQSIDDYKFVRIICDESMVRIFSLRNNTWTIVHDDAPYPYSLVEYDDWGNPLLPDCYFEGGTPLNGAIHWLFGPHLQNNIYPLCALDLIQGKFKIFDTPHVFTSEHLEGTSIGVLGGCLALMCVLQESTTYRSEFWVMKGYGAKESWINILTIHSETTISTMELSWSSLCFWSKTNENDREMILFRGSNKFVIYDAKSVTYKDLLFIGDHYSDSCDLINYRQTRLYVESLVSPNFNR